MDPVHVHFKLQPVNVKEEPIRGGASTRPCGRDQWAHGRYHVS
jgi:hypothetical protein